MQRFINFGIKAGFEPFYQYKHTTMPFRSFLILAFAILSFGFSKAQSKEKLPRFQEHYVRDRETPSSIAQDFNIRLKDFLMLNNFPDEVKLKPGQKVLIRTLKDNENVAKESPYKPVTAEEKQPKETSAPVEKATVKEKRATKTESSATSTTSYAPRTAAVDQSQLVGPNGAKYELTGGNFHVVQKGQTFYRIALIYGLKIEELKELNTMTTTDIKVGQELRISK